ncbi:MAG: efflux transporter periplasmic adaptor subunit [Verrucomicrobia bacterium]|nr:efflux transporter periplasmic adaptor subunit [Verrucomicrobiota bacterium]|tara:strand:+ start:242 stop:1414 length:1173 start_codon:yes stop_codon:yes gene_type:complete
MKTRIKLSSITLLLLTISACGGGEENLDVDTVLASKDFAQIEVLTTKLNAEKLAIEEDINRLMELAGQLDSNKKLPLITALSLNPQKFQHYVEIQGDVMTDQNILVFPEYQGILKKVNVKMGDRLQSGQTIGLIDDGGLKESIDAQKSRVDLAKTTFERRERLWKKDIGSEIQYLAAKSDYESAQKSMENMQAQLAKAAITAPYSGIVDEVLTDEGQLVAPGQTPIVRLVNLDEMYVEADVPESYLATVTQNKTVIVHFPVLDTSIEASVNKTSNYINPDNRTFRIEVELPETNLAVKPNLMAKLKVNDYTNEKSILIPQNLISENASGDQYVYVISNDGGKMIAHKTIISTGLQQNDYVEVTRGLKEGDLIVEEGARTVKDGQEVKIIK